MFLFKLIELYIFETDKIRRINFRTNLLWTSWGELLNLFQNIETRPVVLWCYYKFSFGDDNIFSHVYIRSKNPNTKV
jgi:hypothetical protein